MLLLLEAIFYRKRHQFVKKQCFMCPFWSLEDIQLNECHVAKLRQVVSNEDLTSEQLLYLQNIQDSKGNSFRITKITDDLQRHIQSFEPKGHCHTTRDDNQSDEDNTVGPHGHELDEMLDAFSYQG